MFQVCANLSQQPERFLRIRPTLILPVHCPEPQERWTLGKSWRDKKIFQCPLKSFPLRTRPLASILKNSSMWASYSSHPDTALARGNPMPAESLSDLHPVAKSTPFPTEGQCCHQPLLRPLGRHL